MNFVRKRWIRA